MGGTVEKEHLPIDAFRLNGASPPSRFRYVDDRARRRQGSARWRPLSDRTRSVSSRRSGFGVPRKEVAADLSDRAIARTAGSGSASMASPCTTTAPSICASEATSTKGRTTFCGYRPVAGAWRMSSPCSPGSCALRLRRFALHAVRRASGRGRRRSPTCPRPGPGTRSGLADLAATSFAGRRTLQRVWTERASVEIDQFATPLPGCWILPRRSSAVRPDVLQVRLEPRPNDCESCVGPRTRDARLRGRTSSPLFSRGSSQAVLSSTGTGTFGCPRTRAPAKLRLPLGRQGGPAPSRRCRGATSTAAVDGADHGWPVRLACGSIGGRMAGSGHRAGTLGAVLATRRRRCFVGREAELELFRAALDAAEPPFSVLWVTGPGGIGKSSFLDRVAEQAEESRGASVVRLDGRELAPSPREVTDTLRGALDAPPGDGPPAPPAGRLVLLIDAYERLGALDAGSAPGCCPACPWTPLRSWRPASRRPRTGAAIPRGATCCAWCRCATSARRRAAVT